MLADAGGLDELLPANSRASCRRKAAGIGPPVMTNVASKSSLVIGRPMATGSQSFGWGSEKCTGRSHFLPILWNSKKHNACMPGSLCSVVSGPMQMGQLGPHGYTVSGFVFALGAARCGSDSGCSSLIGSNGAARLPIATVNAKWVDGVCRRESLRT